MANLCAIGRDRQRKIAKIAQLGAGRANHRGSDLTGGQSPPLGTHNGFKFCFSSWALLGDSVTKLGGQFRPFMLGPGGPTSGFHGDQFGHGEETRALRPRMRQA